MTTLIVPYNDYDDATLSVNVTLPAGFEAENTQDDDRDDDLMTSDTTTLVITGVVPNDRVASALLIFRHLLHGANVHVEFFSDAGATSSAWSSSTLPALCYTAGESYEWSTGTNDPYMSESPFWTYFSEVTYRSFKITISGTPTAVTYFLINRIVIGRALYLGIGPDYGLQLNQLDLSRNNRTEGGTRRNRIGESYATLVCDLNWVSNDERGTLWQIMRRAGTARPMVISVYVGDGTSLERDHTLFGYFASLDPLGFPDYNQITKRLQIESY